MSSDERLLESDWFGECPLASFFNVAEKHSDNAAVEMDIDKARLLQLTDEFEHCVSGHGDERQSSIMRIALKDAIYDMFAGESSAGLSRADRRRVIFSTSDAVSRFLA